MTEPTKRVQYVQHIPTRLLFDSVREMAILLGATPRDEDWRMTSALEKSDLIGKRIVAIDSLNVYGGSWEGGWAIASCEITLEDGTVLSTDGQPWSVRAARDKGE